MKFKSLYLLTVLCLLLTACSQEEADPIDYYFCATSGTGDEQWSLYVDGDLIGQLPRLNAVPNCGNTVALSGLLHVSLSQLRHQYEAKDAQGTVRSAGYFKCIENENVQKSKVGGGIGGSSLAWSCDLVIMSFFE